MSCGPFTSREVGVDPRGTGVAHYVTKCDQCGKEFPFSEGARESFVKVLLEAVTTASSYCKRTTRRNEIIQELTDLKKREQVLWGEYHSYD